MSDFVAPWPGETVAVPQRLDGWRVVASAKLPAADGVSHRYAVVVETNPTIGYQVYPEVTWQPQIGYRPASAGAKILPYADALYLFVQIVNASATAYGEREHAAGRPHRR